MVPPPAAPGPSCCRSCGAPLGPHEVAAGELCTAPACRAARVHDAARHVAARNRRSHVAALRVAIEDAATEIRAAASELDGDPERTAYGVVPRQDGAVVPLPAVRRATFASWLDAITTTAFAEPPPSTAPVGRATDEQPEHPLFVAACATCAGACCTLGAPAHAYLSADSIQLFRSRNSGVTRDEVTAHYLGRLPPTSVEDSCVYHGERGCVLPRNERADTCNRYHCNEQTQLRRRFDEIDADRALIVAVATDTTPAVGVYQPHNGRRPTASDPGDSGSGTDRAGAQLHRGDAAVAGAIDAVMSLER